ncbi:MAG: TIGR00268 family protein, partial [Eubacterium sp.]|nr:TIGR00268 family protein [Candidatus Colimonas fimequi]
MIYQKLDNLKEYLRQLGSVAVAFSSGVDSTFLLDVASEVLGEKAIAVTATSEFFPGSESTEADEFCASKGIKQLHVSFSPLSDPAVAANPKDRCYLCKTALFTRIKELAARQGMRYVVEGSNMD